MSHHPINSNPNKLKISSRLLSYILHPHFFNILPLVNPLKMVEREDSLYTCLVCTFYIRLTYNQSNSLAFTNSNS